MITNSVCKYGIFTAKLNGHGFKTASGVINMVGVAVHREI